ncbi:MAG TPA: FtsX-like permease family protein [Actinomycetota bacterium]|nr:FtsX-like permease family protein [Actinomycetota bacterium]
MAGLFAGAVLASAAGARRTDSAYPRFLQWADSPQTFVFRPPAGSSGFGDISTAQLAQLPEVKRVMTAASYAALDPAVVNLTAPATNALGTTMFRRKMLAGRQPDPAKADEVTISFLLADDLHLGVGDHLDLTVAKADGQSTARLRFRVVGVDAAPTEFPPQLGSGVDLAWATPAFYRAHTDDLLTYGVSAVWLRDGDRGTPSFQGDVGRLGGGLPVQSFPISDQSVNTERSIHLQAVALWLLAALLAATGGLIVVQLLARQSVLEAADNGELRAMGMTPGQLWTVAMTRVLAVGVMGAVVAVGVAYALSPIAPIGLARNAEPHPGLAFDPLVFGLGTLGLIAVIALAGAAPAWRAARKPGRPAAATLRPSVLASAVGATAAPATVATGMRFALESGRGRTAVPVRSSVGGTAVALAALSAALVFSTSLNHLLATPALYGVTWDAQAASITARDIGPAVDLLRADPRVAAVSVGYTGAPLGLGPRGSRVDAMAIDAVKGPTLFPAPLEGRVPRTSGEIMLGSRTFSELHAHLGGAVPAVLADTPVKRTLRVVGVGVFPSLSDALGLGKGAAMTVGGLQASLPPGQDGPPLDTALVRFQPGTDARLATADLGRRLGDAGYSFLPAQRPADLVNFGRVQNLPFVLAALLGLLAAATLIHVLVVSIRRRRRDLALLKTLGFVPRQVRSTVAWQATTLAGAAAVLGVPIGILAGRWMWTAFAHQLGIVPVVMIRPLGFVAIVAGALVVANLVALLPARLAGRVAPAAALKAE